MMFFGPNPKVIKFHAPRHTHKRAGIIRAAFLSLAFFKRRHKNLGARDNSFFFFLRLPPKLFLAPVIRQKTK
jgi:hypothetical protein